MTIPQSAVSWLRFEQPWWLLATVAGALPVLVALWARRRGRHAGRVGVAIQSLALVLAAMALARPEAPLGGAAERPWMVLHDVSASTRDQPVQPLVWLADLPREDYEFADTVWSPGQVQPYPGAPGTHAAPALQLATNRAKDLAGVVLLSDGQFQDADWPAAARALGRTGLPVYIVPLDSPPGDARIVELLADSQAGGKVNLQVTVASNASQSRTLRVRRDDPGAPGLLERVMDLLPNEPATIHLSDVPPADRTATYRAVLEGSDAFAQNDQAAVLVLPRQARVAMVGGDESRRAGTALSDANLPVAWLPADRAPTTAEGWLDYAAVVLVDSTGTLLGPVQRAALAGYVRGGGGLVLVGAGPHDSPTDANDPLNKVAALVVDVYERTPLKVVVALDASGSMGESDGPPGEPGRQTKFALACEAVLGLQRHLTAKDSLTVVTFAVVPQKVYESLPNAAPDFAALREQLARIVPAGGDPTKALPALTLAAQLPAQKMQGLVILVTDMQTEPPDRAAVDELAGLFGRNGYRLSVVVVGSGAASQPAERTALEDITERLGSKITSTQRLTGLAEIFAEFLRRARGEPIRRGQFKPGPPVPELNAYVVSGLQKEATALASVGSDPVLARLRPGLGRSVGLAVPLAGSDNASLRGSAALAALLRSQVQWVQREEGDPRFSGQVIRVDDRLHLRLEGRDEGRPINLRTLMVQVLRGDQLSGNASDANVPEVPLRQTAPGRYEADIPAGEEPVGLIVRDGGPDGSVAYRQGVVKSCLPEFAAIGPNWENLRKLADSSGGKVVSTNQFPALSRQWASGRYTSVWAHLLAAAVALVLLEWALSRVWRRT